MGIEPTSKAWEAFVLPLNYTRELLNRQFDSEIVYSDQVMCSIFCFVKGYFETRLILSRIFCLRSAIQSRGAMAFLAPQMFAITTSSL